MDRESDDGAKIDAPDIRIPYRDEDFRSGDIDIYWKDKDDGIEITIKADATIRLFETGGYDGPAYHSPTFKGRKEDLKTAILTAVKNEVGRVIIEEWMMRYRGKINKRQMSERDLIMQDIRSKEDRIRELERRLGFESNDPK